eukprot:gnl/TRDRNA2_/TRDRNA2_82044_c0_seq1.p1 gnl/TRDRNA2_/TRDRNA2_82044_c0~~gnl/TRDRNA2_/TRDRNA2_82044_c0_seq1.p1  ORF type:complete len:526 (-),score=105.42 gnl/TRDRNA2_/TRDRNA2_82044_c0_seq1:51-1628(-)
MVERRTAVAEDSIASTKSWTVRRRLLRAERRRQERVAAVALDTCLSPRSRSGHDDELEEFQPHHALSVPRSIDLASTYASGGEKITTMMLRRIPGRYTQGNLLREIDKAGDGFENSYDFFYLPMDMRNKMSVGYAFINFKDPCDAQRFLKCFTDYHFVRHPSDRVAEVAPAHIQGLVNNLLHFSQSAVLRTNDTKCRPIVLQNGFKKDFHELLAELTTSETGDVHEKAIRPAARELNPLASEFVPGAPCFTTSAAEPVLVEIPSLRDEPVLLDAAFGQAKQRFEQSLSSLLREEASRPPVKTPPDLHLASKGSWCDVEVEEKLSMEGDLAVAADSCEFAHHSELGGWVAEAFSLLVEELPPKRCWVADAFYALVEPKGTALPIAAAPNQQSLCGGGWVAVAFMALLGGNSTVAQLERSTLESELPSQTTASGGGWVADAFRSLTSSPSQPATPRSSASCTGSWVTEAFRNLATSSGGDKCEDFMLACDLEPGVYHPIKPRSSPHNLGDAVQRLRGCGGWAWIAFA